ncbi:MAG: hypothetical protein AAB641_01030 [Patescibacteria group bacterium]
MTYRPLATIFLIITIIFLPYWVYVPALIAAEALLPLYWEGILLGFLIDALYGGKISSVSSFFLSASFLSLAGLIFLIPIRARLRSHV